MGDQIEITPDSSPVEITPDIPASISAGHGTIQPSPGLAYSRGYSPEGVSRKFSGGAIDRSTSYLGENLRQAFNHPIDTVKNALMSAAKVYTGDTSVGGQLAERYRNDPAAAMGDLETQAMASTVTGRPPGLNLSRLSQLGKSSITPADAMSQIHANATPESIPLPQQIKPTAAATVDPYRTQLLPKMQPGTSTTIEAHGRYNPNTQEAVVHFKNGGVYKYKGVPQEVYNQFQNSESQGSFHANNLKGRYVTEKIGQVKPNRFSPGGKQ